MIKKYSLIFTIFLCAIISGFGQVSESFDNIPTNSPGTYLTRNWTGDDGFDWTATDARTDQTITSSAITLRTGSLTNDTSVTNGCGVLSFDYKRVFTGNSTLQVYVNGTQYGGNITVSSTTANTFSATVNVGGNIDIELRNSGNRTVIDNVQWTAYSACSPPANPNGTITGTTPSCNSTTLTYNGTDATPPLLVNYWQTSPTGTDTSNDASNTYNATTTGTYYVRKYDVLLDCWSTNSVSYSVVIESTAPAVTTQPTDQSVIEPNTATFDVTATGASTYQWEVSTNGGTTWNNVTGGIGATTSSYTTDATTLAMDGYQYRCVITNVCGTTLSNSATLDVSVLADVVITEIMYNPPGANDYEWIEICNINPTAQDVSNYTIDVNNNIRFTFPGTAVIPANSCITVLLGHISSSPAPECPFTPDYANPVGTTNYLTNGGATIELVADNGINVIDVVAYDDADSNATAGNGSSFHVIDATLDNSDTDTNWQAVTDGGSPGDNTLVSPCTTFDPEINVEGDVGTFPDISDGDTTPQGTDNTLFATIAIGSSQTKSYRIQNTGTGDLIVTNISITGTNPGDFTVDPSLVFPITVTPGNVTTFEVTFSPIATGTRDATVEIDNNDPDEDPYDYAIRGTGSCVAGSITMSPNNGPVGTIVTVTGSNFGGATTASINGISAPVLVISSTVIEVTIPSGADTSFLTITDELGCVISDTFVVLIDEVSSCEGGLTIPASWTGLMISGLFDNSSGSCHYLELFNPTSSAIPLSGYNIRLSNNQTDANNPFNYTSSAQPLSGTIAAESAFIVQFGNTGSTCSDCPNVTPDIVIQDSALGINGTSAGSGGIDRVVLLNGTTEIDMVANTDYANAGYVYLRNTSSTAPNTTFTSSDWTSQGTADCFGFQLPDFKEAPTITSHPSASASCDLTATLQVTATEGSAGGNPLAYQWYYSAPGDSTWSVVTNGTTYSGATTATLSILDVLNTLDYQFYCEVREDDAMCAMASNATRLDVQRTVWTTSWSNGAPDTDMIAVIDGIYNTGVNGGTNGNINACQLVITTNGVVNVDNSSFIRVVNNVVNNGSLTIQTHGAFVQDGIGVAGSGTSGTFTNNGTSRVLKDTEQLNNWYEYTYWSSPVQGETVNGAFPDTPPNRRFWFNAANYLDQFAETGNNNATVAGQDDIDDDGDDWQIASGSSTLSIGVGYAVTSSPAGMFPGTDSASFIGALNTGDYATPIIINGFGPDNDWNFIGNPYASAIDFDDVYTANSTLIDGAAFLWSHATPPDSGTNGNEVLNFSQNDYAIITVGSGNTAGGSGVIPVAGNFIPSAQGFFVRGIANGNLTFTNSMRRADTSSNNQFFEANDGSENLSGDNSRLWINLTSDNGVFNQILMAYVDGATDANDGWSYDAPRNLSSNLASIIYTSIDGVDDKKYAIQGKSVNSLTLDEVIPVGFKTTIEEPTLYTFSIAQLEGSFLESNTVYLRDHLTETIHNLTNSDYTFTSEPGDFTDRFEIVFTEDELSTSEFELNQTLKIIELDNGDVLFKLTGTNKMVSVQILDLLGRTLYTLDAQHSSEKVFNLSGLSQSSYVVKVALSNGQVITKKAIKRR